MSLILAPIESACGTIVTLVLYCRLLGLLCAESRFSVPSPYSGKNFGVFPLKYVRVVRVSEKLTMKLFLKISNLFDHDTVASRTEGRTDR